jgi:hypothetical protein
MITLLAADVSIAMYSIRDGSVTVGPDHPLRTAGSKRIITNSVLPKTEINIQFGSILLNPPAQNLWQIKATAKYAAKAINRNFP